MTSQKTSSALFKKSVEVRFSDCDPAGIMFFGNIYHHAHDFYEDFVASLGFSYSEWFNNGSWGVPLRHTSAEHLIPIFPGNDYEMSAEVLRVGESSFTGLYKMLSSKGIHAEVTLVHAFIDAKTKMKIAMPIEIRTKLEAYQKSCS